jgi:hypothetical protein
VELIMNQTLYIVIGKPGSGKSTYVKNHLSNISHYEADMYFMKNGEYKFDKTKLGLAHRWCKNEVKKTLESGKDCVVSNTSLTPQEIETYLSLASNIAFDNNVDIEVEIIECVYENASNPLESSCFNSVHFKNCSFEEQCNIADHFDNKDNKFKEDRQTLYTNYSDIIRKVIKHKLVYNEKTGTYTEKYE